MTRLKASVGAVMVAAFVATAAPALAHETIYKGTVDAVEDGRVQATVTHDGAQHPMWFKVSGRTKVKRGDKAVTWKDAGVKKGERIVIIVAHGDETTNTATEIRLAPAAVGVGRP